MTQIPEWADWLARNEDGGLWAFEHHPTKMIEFWFVREGAFEIIKETDNRYAHIKWEDEEPTRVKQKETAMDHDRITAAMAHGYDELPEIETATTHTKDNKDMVNQPNHYIGEYGLEVEDVLRNFIPRYTDPYVGHRIASAIEYLLRSPLKNGQQDIEKARKNLDQALVYMEEKEE